MNIQARTAMPPGTLALHAADTLRIGIPLAAAQLAQIAMGATDTVLLGGIGPDALAAGGLGSMLQFCLMMVLQAVLAAVGILVAQARGARRDGAVPEIYWTGVLLALLAAVPAMLLLSCAGRFLLLLGEPAALARAVGGFVSVLRWCVPGALFAMGLQRAFLPAIGDGWLILPVTVAATLINGLACYGLLHGAFHLPRLGMDGAALATVIAQSFMALALLALTHGSRRRRALVRWSRPRLPTLLTMLRLGLPIGGSSAVESGLFFAVALLIGLLGPAALAAQQVSLNTVSVAFMIPLGLSQAANVRVAHRVGAGDHGGARIAGLVAIALGAMCELVFAAFSLLAPHQIVSLYLDPADTEAFRIAVGLLGVAAMFQVADGIQCVASGALRGLGDTSVPFALAAIGYWGIGFPAAWLLTFQASLGASGAWLGLAAGLTVTAALLTSRFVHRSRRTLAPVIGD